VALDYAHTRTDEAGLPLGIVNRDINAARIRMGPHGRVRLTDFGVALSRLAGRLAVGHLPPAAPGRSPLRRARGTAGPRVWEFLVSPHLPVTGILRNRPALTHNALA